MDTPILTYNPNNDQSLQNFNTALESLSTLSTTETANQ